MAIAIAGTAPARSWTIRIDPKTGFFTLADPVPKRPRGKPAARMSESERQRELRRELHRMLPQPPPQTEPQTGIVAAALPQDEELQRELQRELLRMPPPPALSETLVCAGRLAEVARYTPLPSRAGPGECGAVDLVQLDAIIMPDRSRVAVAPPATLRCDMAEEVVRWIRDDVAPAAASLGSPLSMVTTSASYDCRSRNGVKGAKLSEHGRGNALDVAAIRLRNGGLFPLTDRLVAKSFRDGMRAAACARFMTVLGPGSDGYHEQHVHLDLAPRAHRHRICQWDIREPAVAAKPAPPSTNGKARPAVPAREANAQALPKAKAAPTVRRRLHSSE